MKFQVAGQQQPIRPVQLRRPRRHREHVLHDERREPEPVRRDALRQVRGVPVDEQRLGHAVALERERLLQRHLVRPRRRRSRSTRRPARSAATRASPRHSRTTGRPSPTSPVAFTLNGTSVGSTQTNSSGVATLSGVSLTGIAAGSYPTGVGASFAGRYRVRPVDRLRGADREQGRAGDHGHDACARERGLQLAASRWRQRAGVRAMRSRSRAAAVARTRARRSR